jgi:putative copper export protein
MVMAVSAVGRFCQWLEQTPPSLYIQSQGWIVPAVQTIHIVAISAVLGAALVINLRLIGLVWRDQSLQSVTNRFAPVIWWALPVLLATGLVLIVGEPARELLNPVFRLKIVLIAAAMGLLAYFQKQVSRDPDRYELARSGKAPALLIAIPSLVLWIGIVMAGRWIAYI